MPGANAARQEEGENKRHLDFVKEIGRDKLEMLLIRTRLKEPGRGSNAAQQ